MLFAASCCRSVALADENSLRGSVSAWGSDHVGESFPEYMTGDECLFCHREIGTTWSDNRHQLTVRLPLPNDDAVEMLGKQCGEDVADEVQLLLGSRSSHTVPETVAKVRQAGTSYRRFIGSVAKKPRPWTTPKQNGTTGTRTASANRCAGCHATAVDTATRAFSAVSLDCFTCHGDVQTDHTQETNHALLSDGNKEARQVVSICGQCHLRGGKSKTSGLPYANSFVAGDNLFRDFEVEFSEESIRSQPAIDQHIFLNSRDVTLHGNLKTDCLTCHDVHRQSTDKHTGSCGIRRSARLAMLPNRKIASFTIRYRRQAG